MRAFVFLLIFANLLFFVWTQGYLGSSASPDAIRIQQQLLPEQIVVVARGEPPAVVEKVVNSCLAWKGLATVDADRLERMITEDFSALVLSRSVVPASVIYWVFIAPSTNKKNADKKAAELKRLGVQEFFIVQDPGPNQLAISLGVFSSEASANERLEALRVKGVKSATVGERSNKPELTAITATGPDDRVEAVREVAIALLPEIKSSNCKVATQ